MLVCNVSLRPPRAGIAADIAEAIEATDATASGQVVFATLVDDPASVGETVDAYLGEIMLEAASAAETVTAGSAFAAAVDEAVTAADMQDATAGVVPSAEVAAFLARTSGLDATHVNAYTALIDGLVADGIWAKLDVLHVYATQDSTTALLNLVSSSYSGTAVGSPTFTADQGFTGVGGSPATKYIVLGFEPNSSPSPKFTQNSAHVSGWNLTNTTGFGVLLGCNNNAISYTNIHPKFTDNNAYFRINGGLTAGVAMSDARGHFIANRSASNAVQGYKNGSSVLTNSDTSVGVSIVQFISLANNDIGAPNNGWGGMVASVSIGSSLNSTEGTAFYNRLRTYMTAVGVP